MKEEIRKIAGDVIVGFAQAPPHSRAKSAAVLGAADEGRLNRALKKIASHIISKGHRAEIVDRYGPDMDIKRLAISASMGAFGKSCLVVTPRFGPRTRFGVVLTDVPIEPDEKREFEFCDGCNKCMDACPCGAISAQFNADACEEYNKEKRCLICTEICPVGE